MKSITNEMHLIGLVSEPFETIGNLGFKFYLEIFKHNRLMARIPIYMPKEVFVAAGNIKPGRIVLIDGWVERNTKGSCISAKYAKVVSENDEHCSFGKLAGIVQYEPQIKNKNRVSASLIARNVIQNFKKPEKPVCSVVYANENFPEAFDILSNVTEPDEIEVHGNIGHESGFSKFISINTDRIKRL